jgi:hypothetical protein
MLWVCILQVFIILPYLFVLLVFFPTVIETDTQQMEERAEQLDKESLFQKFVRLSKMLLATLPMTFLLIGYPIIIFFHIIPTYGNNGHERMAVYGSIGSHLALILLLQSLAVLRNYKSFEIADKTAKQKVHSIKWNNYKNWMAVGGLVLELVQLISLPFKISIETPSIRKYLEALFLEIDLFIESPSEAVDTSYFIALGIVVTLFLCYSFDFTVDLRKMWSNSAKDEAREKFFYSLGGTLIYGHNNLKHSPKTATIISLCTDALLLIVCNNLLSVLTCAFEVRPLGLLVAAPDIECWSGIHLVKACIALIAFSYYMPLSIMVSPMLTESGEGEEVKDVKFKTSYLMMISFFKTFIFIIPMFFEQSKTSLLVVLNDRCSTCCYTRRETW